MSLPDYLCPKTARWFADREKSLAGDTQEYARQLAEAGHDDAGKFEWLAQKMANSAADMEGIAKTIEAR